MGSYDMIQNAVGVFVSLLQVQAQPKTIRIAVCLALMPCTVLAGPLEDGQAAFDQKDFQRAYQLWLSFAEKGNSDAQFNVGLMSQFGVGAPRDKSNAIKWYRRAAEQGDAVALSMLGIMKDIGQGGPDEGSEAVEKYRKFAEQGNATAQNNLGTIYANGRDVKRDYVQAYFWFSLAAAQGLALARRNQFKCARQMTPAQIAEAQNLAREWLAKHPQ